MDEQKRQDTSTGNGATQTPILANEKDHTEDQSQQSQPLTSIESGSTKPLSLPEALSLLQTNCFDLRSMRCEVAILARGRRVYIIVQSPPGTGEFSVENGHIAISGKPVSEG